MGSTRPRSVISPVIATSLRTGRPDIALTSAVAIVTPAEGPSFGIAPAGTWMWTSIDPSLSAGMSSVSACVAAYVSAARADSFITSPSWPVRMSDTAAPSAHLDLGVAPVALACCRTCARIAASTNMMSPPAGV